MITKVIIVFEGRISEILWNQLLIVKDSDDACFFALFDIICFPVFGQVLGYLFSPVAC